MDYALLIPVMCCVLQLGARDWVHDAADAAAHCPLCRSHPELPLLSQGSARSLHGEAFKSSHNKKKEFTVRASESL
jgi:hypothetical protein